jgi:hypothetical protein
LEDAFGAVTVDVVKPAVLCAPANINDEDASAPGREDHLAGYAIKGEKLLVRPSLEVVNRFGSLVVTANARDRMLVPSAASLSGPPSGLEPPGPDHFECYTVRVAAGEKFTPILRVPLEDRFETIQVDVRKPTRLCKPANVNDADPGAPNHPAHLMCYAIKASRGSPKFVKTVPVFVNDEFGEHTFSLSSIQELCVPSTVEATDGASQCTDNGQCASTDYCAKGVGHCDGTGMCAKRAELCIQVYDPVCGCDGQFYGNACTAAAAGVNVTDDGACSDPTPGAERACEPPTETVNVTGRRADFPPSLPDPRICVGGALPSNYAMPPDALPTGASEELHVIGVYEGMVPDGPSHGFGEHPRGVVRVTVGERPKPVVLFLSAYEPVRWEITLTPAASLSRIITQGYYDQEVTGAPAGVSVTHRGIEDGFGCMYGWEVSANLGGCDYWTLIRTIRHVTGLTETSFQGCYAGSEFAIPHWEGDPPSCRESEVTGDETLAREEVRFPGCEAVMAERQYCLTTSDGSIALLGLDSGRVCPLMETTALLSSADTHSIAWRGEVLYACTEDGLVRISLRDGASEAVQLPCEAVADADGELLVMASFRDPLAFDAASSGAVWAYPDYLALLGGTIDRMYELSSSTRMTASRDRLFGAWHSTDTVEVRELPSGGTLDPLHLEGYDDWILGMAATDDGELVVSGPDWGRTVVVFDARTGRRLRELVLDRPAHGLSCVRH